MESDGRRAHTSLIGGITRLLHTRRDGRGERLLLLVALAVVVGHGAAYGAGAGDDAGELGVWLAI